MLAHASPLYHCQNSGFIPQMYSHFPSSADMSDHFRESIRELAQKRARKAQWLPDEGDESDEELQYSHLGPHERRYLDAIKTQQRMDHLREQYEAQARANREEGERRRQAAERMAHALERKHRADQNAVQEKGEQVRRKGDAAFATRSNLSAENSRDLEHERNAFTGRDSRPYPSTTVPTRSPSPSKAAPAPTPDLKLHSPSNPLYTEQHESAASVIQQQFRIHRSLRMVSDIALEFETLKQSFEYPDVVDFRNPESDSEDSHISVRISRGPSDFEDVEEDEGEILMEVDEPEPKLAYTSLNYPIHAYVDAMDNLLMRLDGVESWGDKDVREKRRSVVREIGKESGKLERYWKEGWKDYVEKRKEETRKEEEKEVHTELQAKMEVDEDLVHIDHPSVEDNEEWFDVAELAPVSVAVPSADVQVRIGTSSSLEAGPTAGSVDNEGEVAE